MLNIDFKSLIGCLVMALALTACEKPITDELSSGDTPTNTQKKKKFVFTCKGDFQLKDLKPTRAATYLTASDNTLTDLWVLDYMGGTLVQQLHQTSTDADWGQPTMMLAYGSHHVYFVASRGTNATLDTTLGTLTWEKVSDTFWKDYEVTVVGTSNGNRSVTMDRVATKLQVNISDQIPDNINTISITPDHWYYGLDYHTGEAVADSPIERAITIPDSKKGTQGAFSLSFFSLSPTAEWTTNITLTATSTTNTTLGRATIADVPMKRNRVTSYSGNLFSSGGALSLSVNADWDEPYLGTW